jgi:hypothetical protein
MGSERGECQCKERLFAFLFERLGFHHSAAIIVPVMPDTADRIFKRLLFEPAYHRMDFFEQKQTLVIKAVNPYAFYLAFFPEFYYNTLLL